MCLYITYMIHLMIEEGVWNHVYVYNIHDTPNDRGGGVKPCVCI